MKYTLLHNPTKYVGHSHASTIVEHKNELYMSWYVYKDKENDKGQVVFTKFDKTYNEWQKSDFVLPNLQGTSQGNPVLFSFNNTLHLFFVILKRHYWDSAEIYSSSFDEKTCKWSTAVKVNTKEGIMVRHRPMIIGSSAIIPAYDEKSMSTILYSFNNLVSTWSEYFKFSEKGIQGDLISFNDHEFQMYFRNADDNRKIIQTVSANAGKTWKNSRLINLHCPLSGIAAIVLKSGKILVSNNHTEKHKRNPISLSLSDSKGLSFDLGVWHVDKSDIELSYPTLFQDNTGLIHLAFTYNRKMIKHISFTENELLDNLKNHDD